jgi:F-type H+-transporting ATPase subunit delta
MGPTIIARNYAETLLTLAERHGGEPTVDEFGEAIDEVAELLRREPRIREFLATPRVDAAAKQAALRASLEGRVPELFLRFVLIVVAKRRQGLFGSIADEYRALVDERRGRMRAHITLSHPADEALRREIVGSLERRFDKTIVADFEVDRELIGGVVIRVGDQILDGSFRRRAATLRRRLFEARIAPPVGALNHS